MQPRSSSKFSAIEEYSYYILVHFQLTKQTQANLEALISSECSGIGFIKGEKDEELVKVLCEKCLLTAT